MPRRPQPTPLQAFEAVAKRAAEENGSIIGTFQTSQQSVGDLSDDKCTATHVVIGKAAQDLKRRLLDRLAEIFSGHPAWTAGAIVLMKENEQTTSVDIWVVAFDPSTGKKSNDQLGAPAMLSDTAGCLSRIHKLGPDNGSAGTRKLLWSHVLECYRTRLPHYLTRTRKVFERHKEEYDKLVTKLFGVLEEVASSLDYDLGNHIITLHNQACTIDPSQMTKTDYETLVLQANVLLRLTHFEIRLRPLLGATFANELRDCIVLLSRPQRAFDTAVRAALAFPTFGAVKLHRGLPSPTAARPVITPPPKDRPTHPKPTPSPTLIDGISKRTRVRKPNPKPTEDPKDALFKVALHYLPPHERHIGLHRLEPKEKHTTFLLAVSLLHDQNPDPEWGAYYFFGYPACRSEDERQSLGGIYKALLKDCGEKTRMFSEIWRALSDNKLTELMDRHEYGLFRQVVPDLERFLQTPLADRETVWQLVQFIQAENNTDPPPTLRADYAFDLCKTREQVVLLKNVYASMLKKLHPLQLHEACTNGKLLAAALYACPTLEPGHHRFLRPRHLTPGTGYVGTSRGAALNGGHFRNRVTGFTPLGTN